MKRVWLDITNTPQVHFLSAIYRALEKVGDYDCIVTAREFSETAKLLEKQNDLPFKIVGGHHGKNYAKKIIGLAKRFFEIYNSDIEYDKSISCGSESAVWSSFLKRRQSITFGDNDLARQWTYGKFANFCFFPDAIEKKVITKQGINDERLFMYPGYKEDLYLADFSPNKKFLQSLPFDEYVIVRPENIKANYIRNNKAKTITPDLLKILDKKGIHILYLPRYEEDKAYAKGIKSVFVPESPVDGLNAVYHSNGVLTGAGTFAREAACLGVPSFSFFAGSDLLAVDKKLISENKIFFSRDADEIVQNLVGSKKRVPDLNRSRDVRDLVVDKLHDVIQSYKRI